MKTAAILIPLYKKEIDDMEALSLRQCFKILGKYPIIFIVPHNLDFEVYVLHFLANNYNYTIVRFDDRYFESINGYNKLMLSPSFYKAFLQYRFILIYQLDAFVFKDELQYWCDQNYDYIGAPHEPWQNKPGAMQFLKTYFILLNSIKKLGWDHKIRNVGNGGLSLRKTKKIYLLLKLLKNKANKWDQNEDIFFEYWGNILYPFFKLPVDEVALKFSVETSPEESLKKLDNKLPFGCHAFKKYSFSTWEPFLFYDVH